jgi:hypothetical protein
MVMHESVPYRVHIVRHIVINAAHYAEYFARDSVPPALKPISVHWVSVLNFEQGVSLASAHVNSQEVLCCTLLPAQASSRGSDYVEECADESEYAQDDTKIESEQPKSKRVCDAERTEPDEDDPDTVMQERGRLEDAKRFEWGIHAH